MTTRAAHRPSTRDAMLDAAERHLRDTGQLSLASAARAAGVTKAGLMYHFATKEDLMSAVMDHVIDRYERELSDVLAESGRAPDSGAETCEPPGALGRQESLGGSDVAVAETATTPPSL